MKELQLALSFILHWSIAIFMAFYVFFRNSRDYDWLYILVVGGAMIQWVFFRECIISFFEKQILIPGYTWGLQPSLHPSLIFYQLNNDIGSLFKNSLHIIATLLLLYNILYIAIDYNLSIVLLLGLCVFTIFAIYQNLTPSVDISDI
jgi:hypothetical protein